MEKEFEKQYSGEKIALDYKNCVSENIKVKTTAEPFRKTSLLLAYLLNSGFVPFLILGFVLVGKRVLQQKFLFFQEFCCYLLNYQPMQDLVNL